METLEIVDLAFKGVIAAMGCGLFYRIGSLEARIAGLEVSHKQLKDIVSARLLRGAA